MIWNKPRNVWQWLSLLSPAVAAVVASEIVKWSSPPIPPLHLPDGRDIPDMVAHVFRGAWISLGLIAVGSLGIALILARGSDIRERVTQVTFFAFCLGFSNCFVAFCGCASLGVPNSRPDEMAPPPSGSAVVKSPAVK